MPCFFHLFQRGVGCIQLGECFLGGRLDGCPVGCDVCRRFVDQMSCGIADGAGLRCEYIRRIRIGGFADEVDEQRRCIGGITHVFALEHDLEEMDISEYLPKRERREFYAKDKEYIDYLFEAQSFPELYEYKVGIDEYVKVANKQTTSYMLGWKDKNARVGDKITITYDNVQISAEITRLRNYPDYLSLPSEKYGFNIGTYNPYFYDNYTVKEHGGVTLADFAVDERYKVHDVFTVNYWEHQLKGFEDAKEIYLIRKETDVYMHVSYSSEFILKECMGGRTIKAVSNKPGELKGSMKEIFAAMENGVPSIPTRKEIENGCFKEEDYKNYVYLIKLKVKDE